MKEMSKTKKIVALTSVIVAILIGTVGIYSLTKEHTPQFSLKDNKTIKLEYGEKYSTDEMDLLDTKKMKDEDKKILKKDLKVRTNFKYEDGKDYPAIGDYEITYPTAYRYAIAVNYNTACTRGAGSAIFLHCSTGRATAGCISVSQNDMVRILKMLQGDTLIGIYQNKNSLY